MVADFLGARQFSFVKKIAKMKTLFLEDLKDLNQESVIKHLVDQYAGDNSGFDYGEINESDKIKAKEKLNGLSCLIAYEHVGDYGCDSSSFFILKNDKDEYFEIHGGHCSCYGFEGQLDLEKTTLKALKDRALKNCLLSTGGYDNNSDENQRLVNEFILESV